MVIDTTVAEAAMAQALSRIDSAAAALAERLTLPDPVEDTTGPALMRIEAALAALPATTDHAADLAAIRAALDTMQATPAPDHGEALAAIREALDTMSARLGEMPAAPDPAVGFEALRASLDAMAARQEQVLAALAADVAGKLDRQQAAIAALTERVMPDSGHDRDGEIAAAVAEIAARPVVNVDFHREREGMIRLSSAMQTMLGRLDAAANRLIDGSGQDSGAINALGERLDALTAALVAEDALATEPVDTLREMLDQSLSQLDALAAKLAAATAGDGEAVCTLAARIDALTAALPAPDPALPDPAQALRAAFDEGLSRVTHALSDRDGEARSLVTAAERIAAACTELHGLHSRYLDAQGTAAPVPDNPTMVRPDVAPAADPFPDEIDGDLDAFEADRVDEAAVGAPPSRRERA